MLAAIIVKKPSPKAARNVLGNVAIKLSVPRYRHIAVAIPRKTATIASGSPTKKISKKLIT